MAIIHNRISKCIFSRNPQNTSTMPFYIPTERIIFVLLLPLISPPGGSQSGTCASGYGVCCICKLASRSPSVVYYNFCSFSYLCMQSPRLAAAQRLRTGPTWSSPAPIPSPRATRASTKSASAVRTSAESGSISL